MRRSPALVLLLAALLTAAAACGDDGDDDASDTTAAPTTETSAVFDPDGADAQDDDPDQDDPDGDDGSPDSDCAPDPEETNEASIARAWIDCRLPALEGAVNSSSFQNTGSTAEVFLAGSLDEDEALEVCEVTAELFADELTEWTDVQITVSDEGDQALATGTTPGTCEPA